MDKILLHGVQICGRHGVCPDEKKYAQPFCLDLELSADLSRAGQTDDLADTISYADVNDLLIHLVREQSFSLIAPMAGTFEWAGVEIERFRTDV